MSPNSSDTTEPMKRRVFYSIGLPLWVFFGFMFSQVLIGALIYALAMSGVSLESVNEIVFQFVGGAIIYALTIFIVVGVPWLVKKRRTTKEDVGVQRLPTWKDIVLVPAGAGAYLILTSLISFAATALLTFVDYDQAQDTGFSGLTSQLEFILAFISLVIIAPFAEELLFRGYLFGKLRKHAPVWVAVLITSLLFAIVHFQWNVGIDVFALSIVLCLLRVVSGSLWPSIMLHMLKNGFAFYLLFVNPSFLSTLGG